MVTESEAMRIQQDTKQQSMSKQWFKQREYRLTASRFGEICKMTDRRNKEKLCNSLLSTKGVYSKSVVHGLTHETTALQVFQSKFGFVVKKEGLFVSPDYPFLGATPDGVIDHNTIVEVKCPYQGRNGMIKPGPFFKFLNYEDGNICLKTTSNYYYQIQGQLLVCKKYHCFFIVYTFKDLFVQKIEIDREFCTSSLLPKLELFWKKYMRPHIACHL